MTCVISQIPVFIQNTSMEQFTNTQRKELKVLIDFVRVYCWANHKKGLKEKVELNGLFGKEPRLCVECAELLDHALIKRRNCPLAPKPSCKNCHIHCYGKEYRARIREVMAFSGRRMILRGRLDYLWHYLF